MPAPHTPISLDLHHTTHGTSVTDADGADCPSCDGSGEGAASDTTCRDCGGSGEERREWNPLSHCPEDR